MSAIKVDIVFSVVGSRIRVDHGFSLYSALSRLLPVIHKSDDIGIGLIRGRYAGSGDLDISPHSTLVLRVPSSRIDRFLPISGASITVSDSLLTIGAPHTRQLEPVTTVCSPLVTTRNGCDEKRFAVEIGNQLQHLGVSGQFSIGRRRTFGVHGKQIVGYEMTVSELTAEESIALQERGLGGRRKMGCGLFEPVRG